MSSEGNQQGEAPEGKTQQREKVYTIRGLDPDLYDRFTKVAREVGVTVGDLMNMAMSNLLVTLEASKDAAQKASSKVSKIAEKLKAAQSAAIKTMVSVVGDFDLISDIDELTVSKNDLLALDKPVVFSNIKRLVFSPDVDWDTINSKVRSIKVVNELVVPKGVPVLQLAKKCQLVKRIVVQE
ncbi:hypothetical protein [Acidilobus sp.]|uniref:hypothetical protein n=1 Tax=Acidilobus sp. TaxID=1872109 RepID=UPI003CFE5B02